MYLFPVINIDLFIFMLFVYGWTDKTIYGWTDKTISSAGNTV